MSIRINVGATFDARDLKAARRELDALENQAKGLDTAMGRAGRSMVNFGQNVAAVGVAMTKTLTVPIVGAATAATKMAASFQESMSRITGLVGIAADEVKGMESAVLALSGKTAQSPQELAEALFVVTSAGLRGKEALDALEVAAKASAAGLGATRDIARAVAGAMNAYGAESLDAAKATDIVVATARAGNFATDQFASALGRVLPFANQAQASLEDVGGTVALLTRTNGNAAESITQIQALLRAFVVPSRQARDILADVGLTTEELRESMGRRGLVETLRTLDNALGGNRELLGRLLSSTEAASAAFQILNADSGTLQETFGVVSNAAGLTNEAFDVVANQSAFQFRAALNDLIVVGIELGARLLPVVTNLVGRFRDLVDRFNDLSPAQQNAIVRFAAIIALMGPAIALIGGLITGVGLLTIAVGALSVKVVIATGGLALLGAAVAGVAWKAATRDIDENAEAMRLADKRFRESGFGATQGARAMYELRDAQSQNAQAARLAGQAAQFAETGFSAYNKVVLDASQASEDAFDPTSELADILDALGETANGSSSTPGGGGTAAQIVALTTTMRSFFQGLNEVHAGASEAGDLIAQFSREVLAAGNITMETARGAEALARAIRQNLDAALTAANQKLDEARRKFEQYQEAIAGGITSGNTLADAARKQQEAIDRLTRAEEEYERAVASGDQDRIARAAADLAKAQEEQKTFLEFLGVGVTTAEAFAAQIDALREAGVSLEVLEEIVRLGADTGGRIAAELLAGGKDAIDQANAMVDAVNTAAQDAGKSAAQQFFGAGVAAAKAMVKGLEDTLPELQSVLDKIADAIEKALGVRPDVRLDGSGPLIPGTPSPGQPTPTPTPTPTPKKPQPIVGQPDLVIDPDDLQFFADGGLVTGTTLGVIGEAGPEMIIPLDQLGGFGGTVINISVTGAIDSESTARQILRVLRDAERRTGDRLAV